MMPTLCVPRRSGSFRGALCVLTTAMVLTGCASLPSSGPTGVEIRRAAAAKPGQYPFTLVEVENLAHLDKIIRATRRVKGISDVARRERLTAD